MRPVLLLALLALPVEELPGRNGSGSPCTLSFEPGAVSNEAWEAAEGCVRGSFSPQWGQGKDQCRLDATCSDVIARVVAQGGRAAEDRLWAVHDARPPSPTPGSWNSVIDRDVLVHGLLQGRLELAAAALPPAPRPAAETVPASLDGARDLYFAMTQAYMDFQETLEPEASTPHPGPSFGEVVIAYARRQRHASDVLQALRAPTGGPLSHCIHIVTEADRSANQAVALALLESGRPELAAAVALVESGDETRGYPPAWPIRVLESLGQDWETAYLGALVAGQEGAARQLAARGSTRAIRRLLEAGERGPYAEWPARDRVTLDDTENVMLSLAAVVTAGSHCERRHQAGIGRLAISGPWPFSRLADPVPDDLQVAVLDRLGTKVQPRRGQDPATRAAALLFEACRAESIPAFRAMTLSPFDEVRSRGVDGLAAHGEATPAFVPSAPVRVRIVVDGRPARSPRLHWFHNEGSTEGEFLGEDGIASLDRTAFVDPTRPLTSFILSAHTDPTREPWFAVQVRTPAALDDLVTVSLSTQSLTLLDRKGAAGTVELFAMRGQPDRPVLVADKLAVGKRLQLPALERGRYQIRRSGARDVEDVTLGDRPVTLRLR